MIGRTIQGRLAGGIGSMAIAGAVLSGCGVSSGTSRVPPACGNGAAKLVVQASGTATARPDLLTIDMGVDVTDATASAALSSANTKAAALTKALLAAGVVPTDIQTSGLSIQPNFANDGSIKGYQVTNNIVVKLRDLSSSGNVIDTAARTAGNDIRINGINFSVSAVTSMDGTARSNAIHIAAAHARSMAAAAGEAISGICSITDSTNNFQPTPYQYAAASPSAVAGSIANHVPVQPGIQEITAQVSVVYGLVQPKATSPAA